MPVKFLGFLFFIFLATCQNPNSNENSKQVAVVRTWQMPDSLKEISGIVWVDEQRLACVQDELGVIFIYNLITKSVEKKIPFSSPGDFEAITKVDDVYYVMRSDGHIFEINTIFNNPAINEYTIDMRGLENIESLVHDAANQQLLLMGKNPDPQTDSTIKRVYSINLVTKRRSDKSVHTIDLQNAFMNNKAFDKNGKESKKKFLKAFLPSDIAIHPKTADLYITDGRHSSLVILDSTGIIKEYIELDKDHFPQPEGLTFSPNGELFLSSEGVKQKGVISMVKINDSLD